MIQVKLQTLVSSRPGAPTGLGLYYAVFILLDFYPVFAVYTARTAQGRPMHGFVGGRLWQAEG